MVQTAVIHRLRSYYHHHHHLHTRRETAVGDGDTIPIPRLSVHSGGSPDEIHDYLYIYIYILYSSIMIINIFIYDNKYKSTNTQSIHPEDPDSRYQPNNYPRPFSNTSTRNALQVPFLWDGWMKRPFNEDGVAEEIIKSGVFHEPLSPLIFTCIEEKRWEDEVLPVLESWYPAYPTTQRISAEKNWRWIFLQMLCSSGTNSLQHSPFPVYRAEGLEWLNWAVKLFALISREMERYCGVVVLMCC